MDNHVRAPKPGEESQIEGAKNNTAIKTNVSVETTRAVSLKVQPTHVSKGLFKCPNSGCKKTFLYQSELNRHIQTHSNSRPYVCTYAGCGKGFKRFDTLQTHVRLHTGEKPFVCKHPSCGKGFSTKAGLRYHSLKHRNVKVFKCSIEQCGKSFLTSSQLKQHEKGKCHYARAFAIENTEDEATMMTKNYIGRLVLTPLEPNKVKLQPLVVINPGSDESAAYEPLVVKRLKAFLSEKPYNPEYGNFTS